MRINVYAEELTGEVRIVKTVAELRAEGLDIEGARCTRHAHRGTVFRYTLSVLAPDVRKDAPCTAGLRSRCDRTARGPEVPSISLPAVGQLALGGLG